MCKVESLILKRKPPITEEINRFKPVSSLIVKRRWQKELVVHRHFWVYLLDVVLLATGGTQKGPSPIAVPELVALGFAAWLVQEGP